MRLAWILTGIIATLISNNCLALEKCASSMGNVVIDQVTLGCMSINGSASMTGTKFTGDLMLTGPLKASAVKFKGLNVTGAVSINNSQIDGDCHIIGPLSANGSTFNKKLVINATDILLNATNTKDILVESAQPTTLLLTNSTIKGNIVFKNAKGTVTNTGSTISGKIIQPK